MNPFLRQTLRKTEPRLYGDARVVVETFDTSTAVRTTLDYGEDCKVRTP
jgi:hypothetical protein